MAMIMIEDILISEDIVQEQFACNLSSCKGACCIEGDYGAPLTEDEVLLIRQLLPKVLPYLPEASQEMIREEGFYTYNKEESVSETNLMEDGACVFMGRDELGITFCGIQKAYKEGKIDFYKPISCHLYPIRVNQNHMNGFQTLNYDRWDICDAACSNGKKNKVKLYQFVKEALVRKYGEAFYEQLDAAANRKE